MNIYVLQVMSILRQSYCSPKYLYYLVPGQEKTLRAPDGTQHKEVLVHTSEEFTRYWIEAVAALEDAMKRLRQPQEFGAVSAKYLPYVSILPVFAALQRHLKSGPAELKFGGQRKIRHWYWASVFTNRYSGAVESTSARDFQDISSWIKHDDAEPALIQQFKSQFREIDLRRETKTGSAIYNGIFNLLILAGARDWATGDIPHFDELDDHHIVPAVWGGKHLTGNLVHSILNRTPLSADTNRKVIGDHLPNAYLPTLIARNGEKEVRGTLESHFISPKAFDVLLRNLFTTADFEEFITERRRTILDAIESLLIKERLDLAPPLRELDAEVESVELKLRECIVTTLAGDASRLPSHVAQRIRERQRSDERKNPALNGTNASLADQLAYCDLRDLEDIIVGKPIWPCFTSRFGSKESLAGRFSQLADLRNRLRHSRAVDDITRKDGEAAILWFRQVLGKQIPHSIEGEGS